MSFEERPAIFAVLEYLCDFVAFIKAQKAEKEAEETVRQAEAALAERPSRKDWVYNLFCCLRLTFKHGRVVWCTSCFGRNNTKCHAADTDCISQCRKGPFWSTFAGLIRKKALPLIQYLLITLLLMLRRSILLVTFFEMSR